MPRIGTHHDAYAIWIDPRNTDLNLIGNDGGPAVSYHINETPTVIPNLPAAWGAGA